MNGELATNNDTPVTTLAGIFSLSDLLPELPLPCPQQSTLNNRSLLFHPRVSEEARRLLTVCNHALLPQLSQALADVSTQDIELCDTSAGEMAASAVAVSESPQLLQALRQMNAHLFVGDQPEHRLTSNDTASDIATNGQVAVPHLQTAHVDGIESTVSSLQPSNSEHTVPLLGQQRDILAPDQTQYLSSLPVDGDQTAVCGLNDVSVAAPSDQHADVKQEECVDGGLQDSATARFDALRDTTVTRKMMVLLKNDPENDKLMQKALADMQRNRLESESRVSVSQPDSESSDPEQAAARPRNKYFRAKERERDLLKTREREERKRKRMEDGVQQLDAASEAKRIKREAELIDRIKTSKRCHRRPAPVVVEKMTTEELMESATYARFNQTLETILDSAEDADLKVDDDEDADVPQEALIAKYRLFELASEAARLKSLSAMSALPADRLVRALGLLELNVRDGCRVSPLAEPGDDDDDGEDDGGGCRLWAEIAMERVTRSADAALLIMYILTATGMPKRLYLEDCIERVVKFVKYQLQNTIYPAFDPVYRAPSNKKNRGGGGTPSSSKKKRAHARDVRDKSLLALYARLRELVSLLAELLSIQVLTDTTVLQLSSLGVAPFFVENVSDLQLSSLKLVTTVFSKYPKYRRLLLDDILASIARLPSSKRSLRTYKLSAISGVGAAGVDGSSCQSSDVYIQMLTALVMQLIQCVVSLPNYLATTASTDGGRKRRGQRDAEDEAPDETGDPVPEREDEAEAEVDRDVLIMDRYDTAMRTAHNFLSVFLAKCGSGGRSEEIDYRPLFENFIQDLLAAVNRPEWPAAECLLSLLGNLLVYNSTKKDNDMALRVSSLDYLGVVAARLRRDAVLSTARPELIDSIIAEVRREEQRDGFQTGVVDELRRSVSPKKKDKKKKKQADENDGDGAAATVGAAVTDEEEDRTRFLQRILLDYLAVSSERDPALLHCRHFYLAQWYREAPQEIQRVRQRSNSGASTAKHRPVKKRRRKKRTDDSEESSDDDEDDDDEQTNDAHNEQWQREINQLVDQRRRFLLRKVAVFGDADSASGMQTLQTYLDYEHSELICKYLASKRPFSHSFDIYLKKIIHVLSESAIAVRTKAMKCLTMVVEVDPAVLARADMQLGVHNSFLDHSTAVREAAVDLVGKFILSRPELIDKYYDKLAARILDTGVSVRKRVIKIMKDICVECPKFSKIPEICVKMIRRINDEEGIRKLVMEVFQAMWFTPVRESSDSEDPDLLVKVKNITDVVMACQDSGLDWFEQLLNTLFKPKEDKEDSTKVVFEPARSLVLASTQIVDCLVQHVLRIEESNPACSSESGGGAAGGSSQRLVACLTTLFMFARVRPTLLVRHATTLQPYLAVKCQTRGDHLVISNVARTLELVVPLIEHPSETFLAQLEEDSVKLILQHEKVVVASCIGCLGSIVNRVTKNFGLVRDCFRKYYSNLKWYRQTHEADSSNPALVRFKPYFRRSLFTVGLLLRHFDFTAATVYSDLGEDTVNEVYDLLMYFLEQPAQDVRLYTLQALGFVAIRHYNLMLNERTKQLYYSLLQDGGGAGATSKQIKAQVLINLETYLIEEEQRMIKQDEEWSKRAKDENLKEMGDVTSGMASTVIQLYLKRILEAFLDNTVPVRHASLKVIQLILTQGLVHPVQIVPYLVCMSTDPDERISHTADKQLQDIEKKYPGFIQMKASAGIRLSFQLQQIIQTSSQPTRGLKCRENEPPAALNGFLYSILRSTKQQRRAFAMSCMRNFDEHVKSPLSLLLYLADNLACFPYQVIDEVLYIIHQVDVIVSVTGCTLLQSIRESLLPPTGQVARYHPETGALLAYEDEDEEEGEQILQRLPQDLTQIEEALTASEGCNLLLMMKQHLKDFYGITDNKMSQYSPSESGKIYEKNINRRSNAVFTPSATIALLRGGVGSYSGAASTNSGDPQDSLATRAKLATQYLNFKQLMLHIDPADDDDDDGGTGAAAGTPSSLASHLSSYRTRAASSQPPPSAQPAGASDTFHPLVNNCPAEAAAAAVLNSHYDYSAGAQNHTASTHLPSHHHHHHHHHSQHQTDRPPITLSLSALNKQAAAASSSSAETVPPDAPRVPKLTIVPLRFPSDDTNESATTTLRHHKHKHKKSDKHKKKKKKRKKRDSSAEEGDTDEAAGEGVSDPDFTV